MLWTSYNVQGASLYSTRTTKGLLSKGWQLMVFFDEKMLVRIEKPHNYASLIAHTHAKINPSTHPPSFPEMHSTTSLY